MLLKKSVIFLRIVIIIIITAFMFELLHVPLNYCIFARLTQNIINIIIIIIIITILLLLSMT